MTAPSYRRRGQSGARRSSRSVDSGPVSSLVLVIDLFSRASRFLDRDFGSGTKFSYLLRLRHRQFHSVSPLTFPPALMTRMLAGRAMHVPSQFSDVGNILGTMAMQTFKPIILYEDC